MKQSKAQARPKTNFIELRKSINSATDAATFTDTDTSVAIALSQTETESNTLFRNVYC